MRQRPTRKCCRRNSELSSAHEDLTRGSAGDHGGNKCGNLRQRFEMLGLENLGMVRSLQDRKDIKSRNSEQKVMVLLDNLENILIIVKSG